MAHSIKKSKKSSHKSSKTKNNRIDKSHKVEDKVAKSVKKHGKKSKKSKKEEEKIEKEVNNDDIFENMPSVVDEESDLSDKETAEDHEMDDDSDSDLPAEFLEEMGGEQSDDEPIEFDDEGMEEKDEEEDEEEGEEEGEDTTDMLNKDIHDYKKQMDELKERDPEFYEYLQKEDNTLLEFGEESEAEDEDQLEQNEEEEEEEEEEVGTVVPVLKMKSVDQWIQFISKSNDIKHFKKLLSAFKTAARMSEEDDTITFAWKIESPEVFHKVITSTLHYAPIIFGHHLKPKKENGSPITSPRWSSLKSAVKAYVNNLVHLIKNLTDPNMLRLTIREAEKFTVYIACFDRYAKDYLKALLNIWASLGSSDTVRIQSFLAIKSLAVAPYPSGKDSKDESYLDLCLKNVYLTFVKHCKNTNMHTLPTINLLRNLASQLYGIDPVMSYQQGFVYIRQLAIHLRTAMKTRSTKNHNMVYNWQYVHCIDFWADVLNAYASPMINEEGEEVESPLKALIYPFVQVSVGVIQLIPTAQYYPLRFHILKTLNSLIANTSVYIPIATYVLEVLEGSIARDRAHKTNSMPLDWNTNLRIHKKNIHSHIYQDEVLEQCAIALKDYYKHYSHHISFPEMVDADIIALRRFLKQSKSIKGKEKLRVLTKDLEAKANFVRQKRALISFAPQDKEQVMKFNEELKSQLN
ncbi:Noc2p family-domain-containing protein [Pilobolus umbonatus]|nr:Noc2p family-domain-containing protein [Pilobolus umbonatus]